MNVFQQALDHIAAHSAEPNEPDFHLVLQDLMFNL